MLSMYIRKKKKHIPQMLNVFRLKATKQAFYLFKTLWAMFHFYFYL